MLLTSWVSFSQNESNAGMMVEDDGSVFVGYRSSDNQPNNIHSYQNSIFRTTEVTALGEVTLTEDDRNVLSISPKGYLKVYYRNWVAFHKIEFQSDADGKMTVTSELEDGKIPEWFTDLLPELTRTTALGAKSRIKRIIEKQGLDAAIQEIVRSENNAAKEIFAMEILESSKLTSRDMVKTLKTAAEEISSSSRLGHFIGAVSEKFKEDDLLTVHIIKSVNEIGSSSAQEVTIMFFDMRDSNFDVI